MGIALFNCLIGDCLTGDFFSQLLSSEDSSSDQDLATFLAWISFSKINNRDTYLKLYKFNQYWDKYYQMAQILYSICQNFAHLWGLVQYTFLSW